MEALTDELLEEEGTKRRRAGSVKNPQNPELAATIDRATVATQDSKKNEITLLVQTFARVRGTP